MKGVEALLDEVRNLGNSFPHLIRIRIIRAMDLSMAIAAWANLKQMEAVDSRLKELRDLQAATPEAPSIARWLAEGLENTILAQINTAGSTNAGQIERINDLLRELRRLHRKFLTNDNITDHLAAGIAWAVGAHGNIRSGFRTSLEGDQRNVPEAAAALAGMPVSLGAEPRYVGVHQLGIQRGWRSFEIRTRTLGQ